MSRLAVVAFGGNALVTDAEHDSIPQQYETVSRTRPAPRRPGRAGLATRRLPRQRPAGRLHPAPLGARRAPRSTRCRSTTPSPTPRARSATCSSRRSRNELARRGLLAAGRRRRHPDGGRAWTIRPSTIRPSRSARSWTRPRPRSTSASWAGPSPRTPAAAGGAPSPSPRPPRSSRPETIRDLLDDGAIVVAGGGGGIPVTPCRRRHRRRCRSRGGQGPRLGLLAARPRRRPARHPHRRRAGGDRLRNTRAAVARSTHRRGGDPARRGGSVRRGQHGPKVEALVGFVKERPGGAGVITSPERLGDALARRTGTWIEDGG